MLGLCDRKTFLGHRDAVTILLLLDTGIRVSEACRIVVNDVNMFQRTIHINGKGARARLVGFGVRTRQEMHRWLQRLRKSFEAFSDCPLLPTEQGTHMSAKCAYNHIHDLCTAIGVLREKCGPHTFRHTFAKSYLRAGGDMASLQRLLGHSSPRMTLHYARMNVYSAIMQHRKFSPGDRLGQ